jgi:hypothetical protein
MAGLLLRLLSDMMHDDRLRRRFNAGPYVMMNEYGLSPEAQAVFYLMDRTKVGEFVKQEIINWPFPPGWDVIEADPDCAAIAALYPDPQPLIYLAKPDTGASTSAALHVTVKGAGFSRDATVSLIDSGGTHIAGTGPTVSGTYRCCHLRATFDLTKAAPGGCTIEIINSPGVPKYKQVIASAKALFTVT